MNSSDTNYDAKMNDAANAIVADDREQLREHLESIEHVGDSVVMFLWQAWAAESIQDKQVAIQQALEFDPRNEIALAGLTWLEGIQESAELQLELKRQAEAKAEEEARLAAEAEAKAEEEARLAAEAEAKAEEEARLAAEAEEEEAQAKAEEERLRALEEAQAKIDEARVEAELAARALAEEARIQAEQEAIAIAEEEELANSQEETQAPSDLETTPLEEASATDQDASLDEEEQVQAEELLCDSLPPSETELPLECEMVEAEIKATVDLIAEEVHEEVTPKQHDDSAEFKTETDSKKIVILAVDDSPTIRKLVSLALTSQGYEVVTAEDGSEALFVLGNQLPDLILSDINMPKLGGYKLCRFVKKHDRTKNIPVIMLSGKDGVFDKMRGKLCGCDDFIGKAFESAELIAKVREHLNLKPSNV